MSSICDLVDHERGDKTRIGQRVQTIFDDFDKVAVPHENPTATYATGSILARSLASRCSRSLVSSLSCVSSSDGQGAVQNVVDSLLAGALSVTELASVLLDSDAFGAVEALPPLCNLALLIRKGIVRLVDIRVPEFRSRAIYEQVEFHDCECGDRKGTGGGLKLTLKEIFSEGRSQQRDSIVLQLLYGILAPQDLERSVTRSALVLVRPVLESVVEEVNAHERSGMILRWARHSTLNFFTRDTAGEEKCSEFWTTELRGLAVGQPTEGYLLHGKDEERALIILFELLDFHGVVALASEIVASIVERRSAAQVCNDSPGTWSRICVFFNCIGSREASGDHKESPKAIIANLLVNALSSKQGSIYGRGIAAIIVLARTLLSHSQKSHFSDDSTAQSKAYGNWFSDVIETASKPSILSLISALRELVPSEPVLFLHCQTMKFRMAPSRKTFAEELISAAQQRLSNLDPTRTAGSSIGVLVHDKLRAEKAKRKAVNDLCKFILDFHRKGSNKVPESLVRSMNFHRHEFRAKILPLFLMPDIELPEEFINRNFSMGGIDVFDQKRIDLIKILAYERKDRAITKDEADDSIPKIEAIIRKRRLSPISKKDDVLKKQKLKHVVSQGSSLSQVFQKFCSECGSKMSDDIMDTDQVADKESGAPNLSFIEDMLVAKLTAGTDLISAASSLLELITNEIYCCLRQSRNKTREPENDKEVPRERDIYHQLWKSCEPWLCLLLTQTLGRKSLLPLREALKVQCFASLCLQTRTLTMKQILGIAVIMFGIVKGSELVADNDLGIAWLRSRDRKEDHIVTAVSQALPLDCKEYVVRSTRFAICYLFLVIANCQDPSMEPFPLPNGRENYVNDPDSINPADADIVDPVRENEGLAQGMKCGNILPPGLVAVVHWILCTPWRLFKSRISISRESKSGSISQEVASVLGSVLSAVQAMDVFEVKKFSVKDWTLIEMRAGWGLPTEVSKIIVRFSKSGRSLTKDLLECACAISTRCAAGAALPSWIILGLSECSKTTLGQSSLGNSRLELNGNNTGNSDMSPMSFSEGVEKNFHCAGNVGGRTMIAIAQQLPASWYFGTKSVRQVCLHISETIMPRFWPLSRGLCLFLWDSLLSSKQAGSDAGDTDSIAEKVPSAFLADLAFHTSKSLHGGELSARMSHCAAQWKPLIGSLKSLEPVYAMLLFGGGGGALGGGALFTQTQAQKTQIVNGINVKALKSTAEKHLEAVAFCILRLAREKYCGEVYIESFTDASVDEFWDSVGNFCMQLGSGLAVDILDIAVDVSAHLPICKAGNSRTGISLDEEKWCSKALVKLLSLRLDFFQSHIPYWVMTPRGCRARDIPFFVSNARKKLGFFSCLCNSNELNNAVATGSCSAAGAGCFQWLWEGRICSALAFVESETQQSALNVIESSPNRVSLDSMLQTVRSSVRSANHARLKEFFTLSPDGPSHPHAVAMLLGTLDKQLSESIEAIGKLKAHTTSIQNW